MSTDPVHDAGDYWDRVISRTERQQAAEEAAQCDFIRAIMACDLQAPATFAQTVQDFERAPLKANGTRDYTRAPRREQTVLEVASDSLDYPAGPTLGDVLTLVARAADGWDVQREAASLISHMAHAWASHNVEIDE